MITLDHYINICRSSALPVLDQDLFMDIICYAILFCFHVMQLCVQDIQKLQPNRDERWKRNEFKFWQHSLKKDLIQKWVCLARYCLRNKPIRARAAQHSCYPNNLTQTQCVHQVYMDFGVGGREEHLVATWDLSAAGCFLYIMTADMAVPSEITVSM